MKRVLVADDTKNIRALVCKCLQLEGYETHEAADGRQALELLQSQSFHLAFLDIKMPGISGTEVLKTIRAAGIPTPVIIITAFATVKNAVECTQLGAVAYLLKPFTADKLRNVLAELMIADSLETAEKMMSDGRVQEALLHLQRLLSERPLDSSVYQIMARASELLGKSEDARKYLDIVDCIQRDNHSI
jgi:two-component system, OmpR family, response regulator